MALCCFGRLFGLTVLAFYCCFSYCIIASFICWIGTAVLTSTHFPSMTCLSLSFSTILTLRMSVKVTNPNPRGLRERLSKTISHSEILPKFSKYLRKTLCGRFYGSPPTKTLRSYESNSTPFERDYTLIFFNVSMVSESMSNSSFVLTSC